MPEYNLHLTLHFVGAVHPDRLDALTGLGDSIGDNAFGLVLDEIGYWSRPQVICCGPSSPPTELGELHRRLGEGLRELGFTTETRPYRPHVTLARKVRRRPAYGPLVPLSWWVREWALVASGPGPAPVYEPLCRWHLP